MAAHCARTGSGGRGKCPICGRPSEAAYLPFCSRRCADVDLARWLSGGYVIPGEDHGEDGGETADSPGEAAPNGNGKHD